MLATIENIFNDSFTYKSENTHYSVNFTNIHRVYYCSTNSITKEHMDPHRFLKINTSPHMNGSNVVCFDNDPKLKELYKQYKDWKYVQSTVSTGGQSEFNIPEQGAGAFKAPTQS